MSPSRDTKGKSDMKGAAPPKPVVVLSSKSQNIRGAKELGAKKLGTKTLVAKKIESSGFGGDSAMNNFDDVATTASPASGSDRKNSGAVEPELDQEAADRMIAEQLQREEESALYRLVVVLLYVVLSALIHNTVSLLRHRSRGRDFRTDTFASKSSLYRSPAESSSRYESENESMYSGRESAFAPNYNAHLCGTGYNASSYTSSSSTFDKEKYKNAKGIGSDMLNEADRAADPSEQIAAQSRIAHFSGSTAISSDAVRAVKFSLKSSNNNLKHDAWVQ